MANVKITDLTELSAADSAAVDVFPIVDIDADATKKITIASLRTTVAAANDFVTYTNITANVDIVQDNVAAQVVEATAIEARRVANIAGAVSTITTGNLSTGRAIISDGSGKVAVSPVTSTELGYVDGVTSAIQTQIDTKIATTDSAANDFVTFTILDANIDVVSANATAVEARRVANIAGAVSSITTADLTASRALVSDGSGKVAVSAVTSTELGYVDGVTSAIQTQIDTKISTADSASNDFITYSQLNANINLVQDNVAAASGAAAVEVRRVANIQGAVSTITTGNLTASRALVSDGSGKVAALASVTSTELGYLDATSSVQTQIDSKIATTASASNDFVTYTRLNANIDVVSANAAAVETKRVANIAGAVSTITTADLTASRAVVSDGSGKVAVSAVTATEIGYLDGVSSAIQTQLDTKGTTTEDAAIEARRVANIAGAVSTITTGNLSASKALVSDGSGKVSASAVTSTELGYVDGVTSAIQTQIDSKQATITGAATTIDDADLTASRAVVSDGSGKVAVSAVTSTEIGYLDGVSSAIQTQLNAKAPLAGATFTGQVNMSDDLVVTGNLTVNGDTTTVNSENKVIQDRFIMLANAVSGAPSADVGIFFNRGTSGNAALYYDESAKFFTLSETRDPDSNIAISPTGAANLAVGQFTATSVKYNGADLNTAITDNRSGAVSTVYKDNLTASRAVVSDGSGKIAISAVTSTEVGYLDGVTSAIQTQIDSKQATITGAATTIDDADLTASRAVVSDGSGKVAVSAVTSTELGYLDGVSSAIQTQIDSKQATITGAATTIDDADLTASRAIVSDGSGKVAVSAVTSTEIGYLDGVSSAIQTQINTTNTNLSDNSSRIAATVTETTAVEARRVANIAGAVSTITTGNLTASRAVVSDGSGKVAASAVTATELGYVDGVTSAIQTQIDSKQATITGAATTIDDTNLTASRALASDGSGKVAVASTTTTELNQLNAITRGSLIYGNASGATARLAAGGADKVLTSDGTDISWEDPAGGVEIRGYTTATTLAVAPGTTDSDLGNLTDTSLDAFDVKILPSYDLMEPIGSIISVDCGAF